MNPSLDRVRDYWNAQPCNIHHSAEPVGTREYFEEVSARKYLVEPHIPRFADFPRWSGKTVLEIGCGIGTDAEQFATHGARYTGIDISESSLALAKQRFELMNLPGTFILGNAENLPDLIPVQHFDLIYSFGSIHHTPNPQSIVDSVLRFMGEDSQFRLMLYAKNSWKDIMIEAGLDQFEAQSGCPVARTFTESDVRYLLRDYNIVKMEQEHIFPYVVEDYIDHRYTVQPWFKTMPNHVFRALERRLGWHFLIIATRKEILDKARERA